MATRQTFESPFGKDTESDAYRALESIRESYNAKFGWVEINGYVEKREDGKWYAVRVHENHSV